MPAQPMDPKEVVSFLEAQLESRRAQLSALTTQVAALESAIEKARLGFGMAPMLPLTGPSLPSNTAVAVAGKLALHEGVIPDLPARAFRLLGLQEAIGAYLGIVRRQQTTGQITKALRTGGFHFETTKTSKTVSQALVRMWRSEKVTRTVDNLWGLAEWGAVANPYLDGNVAA